MRGRKGDQPVGHPRRDEPRRSWTLALAAAVGFTVLALVSLGALWLVIMFWLADGPGGAVFPGFGTGGEDPTAWWFYPLYYSSLALLVGFSLRLGWKVWKHNRLSAY